ncbi:hypothetical protein, conserved [Eimeria tenella]|uniref:DEK-C domain-containing protein n=1 Tax=Eimeria tenella TaxID=5802 RepID=H9B9S4_EIMTE|nr:hypothetical protein, conserved [Eimeria tenella]AET50734.1 hypothetical protein [Eimeria tenella]CDJ42992.1 hypothetical protein, conserved [Eimeria tenella]|eukprot:XP_013233742.1 hypothetical protein, conserved [Eimeria tenella]
MAEANSFDPVKAEEHLREVITAATWRDMSRKSAREKLEEKLGVAAEGLKEHKKEINEIIDKIVSELNAEEEEEEEAEAEEDRKSQQSEAEGESDEEQQPAKKQKTGNEPPKNLKKLQSALMSRQSFLEKAPVMNSKIGNLIFQMKPRTFSSGSCGWFHGGKVAIKVGDQEIWCQLGVNCTVLGSKEWRDGAKKGKK